jgi:hypothetical protein
VLLLLVPLPSFIVKVSLLLVFSCFISFFNFCPPVLFSLEARVSSVVLVVLCCGCYQREPASIVTASVTASYFITLSPSQLVTHETRQA